MSYSITFRTEPRNVLVVKLSSRPLVNFPTASPSASDHGLKTLVKSLRVLELFRLDRPEWGASEVSRQLLIPVPTAHRILQVLADHGYLARVGRGRFRLGLAAIALGTRALSSSDLQTLLRPRLTDLAATTGETALLTVPADHGLSSLCVDRVESHHTLRLSLEIGRLTPLNAGASAKALLAFLPEEEIANRLSVPLPAVTPKTITDPERLRADLAETRRRGYAISMEETDPGAGGVAAPVRTTDGYAIAAIGVAGPLHRLGSARLRQVGGIVRRLARVAESDLGAVRPSS